MNARDGDQPRAGPRARLAAFMMWAQRKRWPLPESVRSALKPTLARISREERGEGGAGRRLDNDVDQSSSRGCATLR